jgi:FolB domain-containing protein
MDLVRISDFRIESHVGVTEEERAEPQSLLVSLDLRVDLAPAGLADDLDLTVDYGQVTIEVAELIRSLRPRLLETIAEQIAAHLAGHPGILGVTVEVLKVKPPIPENLGAVGVKIERDFVR